MVVWFFGWCGWDERLTFDDLAEDARRCHCCFLALFGSVDWKSQNLETLVG
jgi:hypothetical protein